MSAVSLRAAPPRDRYSYDHLRLDPVTPTIGAEIAGIDLRQPLSPGEVADVRRALNEWRVVFFRDQDIDPDQLKAFGRSFGPLTPAHPIAAGLPDHPALATRLSF